MGAERTDQVSKATSESSEDPSAAANKKTLSDIDKTEKDTGPASGARTSPSPDGAFDEPGQNSDTETE